MNNFSICVVVVASLSGLIALPSQARADTLMDILTITGSTNRAVDCISYGRRCLSKEEEAAEKRRTDRALERIKKSKSKSGSSSANGGSKQNQTKPSIQSESTVNLGSFCNEYLRGAAISGNYASVPYACRQYMPRPSSSQRSNRRDSDRYVEQQELRTRQIERNANINLESMQDSNCLASSEGCVRIRRY